MVVAVVVAVTGHAVVREVAGLVWVVRDGVVIVQLHEER
jgi:hypothetical protein